MTSSLPPGSAHILGSRCPFRPMLRLLFAAAALGLAGSSSARAQDENLDVGVRSHVVDGDVHAKATKTHPGEGGHGKIYGVLAVSQIPAGEKIVKPVDANRMLEALHEELAANGFKRVAKGHKPEILLTVSYGRGYLPNPYTRDTGELTTGVDQTPTMTITGAMPLQLYDAKTPGWEANLQKNQFEKLYIRVTAWEYPSQPNAKSKMLWKTIMVVDDPDHRDLNASMAKMLEAGAPYFDKEPKATEVNIYKPVPEGRVNVGTPEVVQPKK
jgi:hypothetical protein